MTPEKEQSLTDTYQRFLDISLRGAPVKDIRELIDPAIIGLGTAYDEKVESLDDYLRILDQQRAQAAGMDFQVTSVPVGRRIDGNGNTACMVEDIGMSILAGAETIEFTLRLSTVLECIGGRWMVVHFHGSKPVEVSGETDTWHVEEWKHRNAQLEEQVAEKTAELARRNRELEVEAALERVRARTMGMQHSTELREVVSVLNEQIESLKLADWGANILVFQEAESAITCWISLPGQAAFSQSYVIRGTGHPVIETFWKSWKEKTPHFTLSLTGLEKLDYTTYLLEKTDWNYLPDEIKASLLSENSVCFTGAWMKYGLILLANTTEPAFDEHFAILNRFANVFEQTYTRFLDLERAQVHARDIARQASLDRVRAEIASMRTPEDLRRITPLIWKELSTLEVPFFRCGLFIIDEAAHLCRVFLTTPVGEPLAALDLPYGSSDLVDGTVQHWRAHAIYKREWNKAEFLQWMQSLIDEGYVRDSKAYQGNEEAPEHLALHFVPFTQGMLYVGSESELQEGHLELVQALADAFSVAYSRYEDFKKLEKANSNLEQTLSDLKSTQFQLIQQEKLASLGQLTAGIAHEIKNPLNFVNNFSEVSKELLEEMREEIQKGDWAEVEVIAGDLEQNLEKIHQHGSRADGIVQSMLLHSRGGSGAPEPTDLNAFVREYVNLAYHGMRAGREPINVTIDLDLEDAVGEIPLVVEDFSRVILNLCHNAFDAMRGKLQAKTGKGYQPCLRIRTHRADANVSIEIADNGPGIPEEIRDKIMQPFFTTKKGTAGTGLGLSIAHDIVKAHGGHLTLDSAMGVGTTFGITLPSGKNGN